MTIPAQMGCMTSYAEPIAIIKVRKVRPFPKGRKPAYPLSPLPKRLNTKMDRRRKVAISEEGQSLLTHGEKDCPITATGRPQAWRTPGGGGILGGAGGIGDRKGFARERLHV